MKTIRMIFLPILSLTVFSSCAMTRANYVPLRKIEVQSKTPEEVEYLLVKPQRSATCIGAVEVNGNGYSDFADIIAKAKKKAAEVGGDFILQEKAGSETKTIVNPGYSSYQSNGNAFISGNQYSAYGSANQNAFGYSVGPSISTLNLPWAVYSVWIYAPCRSGINFADDDIVTGFRLNSDAESSGIRIGDKLLGIDGFDIKDEGLAQHLMTVQPGDKMVYSMLRDGKRIDYTLTAMPN